MAGTVRLHLLGADRLVVGGPFDAYEPPAIGVCLERQSAKADHARIRIDIADLQPPTQAQFTEGLAAILAALHDTPEVPLYIGCRAGIGRTGTFIAGLAKLGGGQDDPVGWTRRHYHSAALETQAQRDAVAALDLDAVWEKYRRQTELKS